MTGWRRDLRDR